MRLWSDEVEAMRPEAREVAGAAIGFVQAALAGDAPPPADLHERARWSRERFAMTFPPSAAGAEERTIAGVPCRVFLPEGTPTAVYLHFHGGGMILGAAAMNDMGNAQLAERHGMAVISVEYRLAPEHPYPAGPDDGMAVARWLLDEGAAELGSDRILIGGESAGGYMAAAVLLRIRDELGAADRVDGANLVFGVFDWGLSPSQRGVRATDRPDMLSPEGIVDFGDCYLPGRTLDERRDPAISPAFAPLHDLPPALFSVGTADHLLDDTLLMAGRWAAAGNEMDLFVAPDMPHGFLGFPCAMTTAWAETTDRWIADVLARGPRRVTVG